NRQKTLLIKHLAAAAAGRAGHRAAARFSPFPVTVAAGFKTRSLDLGRHPEHGVLEIDLKVVTQILSALRSIPPSATTPTEEVTKAKNSAQDIAKIGKSTRIKPAVTLYALMAEAVVGGPLLRIAQYAISLRRLFKAFFGLFVIGIAVRMMLER